MTPEMQENLVAVFIVGIVMLIPIITVLLKHQQKMAMIYREGQTNHASDERVLQELAELRQLIVHQSLAIENLRKERVTTPPVDPVQTRLSV